MSVLFEILFFGFLCICGCYLLLITFYNVGWFSIKRWKNPANTGSTRVSVIVPVRNESGNIEKLLENLCSQTYSSELYEIIIADDCSDDNTSELVKNFMINPGKNISLVDLFSLNKTSKKQAITEAIKISKGDLIITTDADCLMPAGWITAIVSFYESYKPAMIIGPVRFSEDSKLFGKLQGLEFISLIASGAASAKLGYPTMCNGANLAYEKKAFIKAGGFESDKEYSSGDDVFLMHKLNKAGGRILFLKCVDSIVETRPQPSLKAFINQRKRWVSKSKGYKDISTIVTALIVYLFNLSLVAGIILSFFSTTFLWATLFGILIKAVVDFPILMGMSAFAHRRKWMAYYIPLQILYPAYIVIVGFLGIFGDFEWKDRKYES